MQKTSIHLDHVFSFSFAVFMLLLVAGCNRASLGDSYPEPFYGQLLVGDSLITPVAQAVSERIFEDSAFVVVKQFAVHPDAATSDTPAERILPSPTEAVVDAAEEYLYLFDREQLMLHKYRIADGALEGAFNIELEMERKGGATMGLMSDEVLWIAGLEQRKLIRITTAGERLDDLPLPEWGAPMVAQDGAFVMARLNAPDALFHSYSASAKKRNGFAVLTNHKVSMQDMQVPGHGMGFIGGGLSDGSASFVYVGLMGGGLLSYNMDGTLRYFRESIMHNTFPGVMQDTMEARPVLSINMEGVKGQQIPMNEWNGEYYEFYSQFEESGTPTMYWDAYQYDTGDYLYSIRPRTRCGYNFITREHVYAYCLNEGFFQLKRADAVEAQRESLAATD